MVPIWVHAWLILLSTVYLKNFAILEYNFIPFTHTFLDEKTEKVKNRGKQLSKMRKNKN